MFQEFPYSDMHQLNLDWIIKIAKDFLDQYTHIQQLIADGETSLQNLTEEGLQQLQDKADNLETLLQEWYNTHSEDIANQLASALSDLNAWYNLHQDYLDNTLSENIALFDSHAEAKLAEVLASIPDDYTELGINVAASNHNIPAINNTWFIQKNAGSGSDFTSVLTSDPFGRINWSNNTPSTASYNYMALDIGLLDSLVYDNLKNVPFTLEIEGDANVDLQFIVRISKQASWAPVYSPYTIANTTVHKGESFFTGFIPSKIVNYDTTDHLFILIEQVTKPNVAVNVGVRFTVNATNAINAIFAKHGGFIPLPEAQTYFNPLMSATIHGGIVNTRGKYTINIPANNGATGQAYCSIGIPVKKFIAEGRKIKYKLEKNNLSSPWSWDAVRLSTSISTWNPDYLVKLLTASPYNVAKAEYEIDLGKQGINVSQYAGEIYLVFDTFYNNPTATTAVQLTATLAICNEDQIIATGLVGFVPDDYTSKKELAEIITVPTIDLVCWGDSLTIGAGGGGTNFPAVCASLLGLRVGNAGVGGENAGTIAARQGGNNLIIPPGPVNGTYTELEMVDNFGNPILPLIQGGNNMVNPVLINGQECNISYSNNTYTISGYTGTIKTEVPALFNGAFVKGEISVIFIGNNGPANLDERIAYIDSMITRTTSKYIVMGLTNGNESEKSAEELILMKKYGNHFFNTRKMLVKYGLDIAGITPTTQDNSDIAVGLVPTSLRSDHIHLNAAGYTALGTILASYIVGLGYATYA